MHSAPEELLPKNDAERRALEQKAISLPAIALTAREVSDLEQILVGGFAPLRGFMTKAQYDTVLRDMRLPTGELWPMPITLAVSGEVRLPQLGGEVALTDEYGNVLAIMAVESVWEADPKAEARAVYGTEDPVHAGVAMLLERGAKKYVGGTVTGIKLPVRHDFKELRKTPRQLREHFKKIGAQKVIAFQTRNPVHRAHYEIMRRASTLFGINGQPLHILLHPVVGGTKEGDIDYISRVRAYKRLKQVRLTSNATLALLELAMRMAGPREALWHALVRRNYGATHFIVGRDHAGPGPAVGLGDSSQRAAGASPRLTDRAGADRTGTSFYPPFAAQELVQKYEAELGMTIVAAPEFAYSAGKQLYLPAEEIMPEDRRTISGTQLRAALRRGEALPDWFSFPEVLEELARAARLESARRGVTIFFTGLSGAGKSTVAHVLHTKLLEESDRQTTLLDGDIVRRHLSKGLGFSREDRDENIMRIGYVASEVTRHGGIAICAAIAPYEAARARNRARIGKTGAYIEVYVSTPLSTCVERDPKGLYRKALSGGLKGVTGIDDPYEAPRTAEITIDTKEISAEDAAEMILDYLRGRKLI